MTMTTWRVKLDKLMHAHKETWADVVKLAIDEGGLDYEFDDGFGVPEGPPFTLWTKNRVYFPIEYDGAEGVASVPRNPCDERINHDSTYREGED